MKAEIETSATVSFRAITFKKLNLELLFAVHQRNSSAQNKAPLSASNQLKCRHTTKFLRDPLWTVHIWHCKILGFSPSSINHKVLCSNWTVSSPLLTTTPKLSEITSSGVVQPAHTSILRSFLCGRTCGYNQACGRAQVRTRPGTRGTLLTTIPQLILERVKLSRDHEHVSPARAERGLLGPLCSAPPGFSTLSGRRSTELLHESSNRSNGHLECSASIVLKRDELNLSSTTPKRARMN